jgi:cytochrome c oxidase cbb3-type subunit 1
MEGLMWREYTPQGYLANAFVETVAAKHIPNIIRTMGGLMFLSGALFMSYNVCLTIRTPAGELERATGTVTAAQPLAAE